MTAKANEPAYPNLREQVGENTYRAISNGGATMRQAYKLAALQGLCANLSIIGLGEVNGKPWSLIQTVADLADAACAEDEEHENG